jgi:predicted NACHT family NTPase
MGITASEEGAARIKAAFKHSSRTQTDLARSIAVTRQTVGKFLGGKPIEQATFQALCQQLGLNWQEIAAWTNPNPEIPALVAKDLVDLVRAKVQDYLLKRCGTMRVLDMEQPITLDSIYTTVNILDQVSRNRRLSVNELHDSCGGRDFDRLLLGAVKAERVPGLEAVQRHPQLMIWGKPGAGKTTFLKWLTLQCLAGAVQGDRVPFFITLKEFAETEGQPDLVRFLTSQLQICGVAEARQKVEVLLHEGRWLLLLDGLDEVRSIDHDRVLTTIRQASQRFAKNQFIITCRIAAREYTFDQFTEVEIADFDEQQIADFATKWFQPIDVVKAEEFPQVLQKEGHQGLRELATNPLLLTLLCLVFGSQGRFPTNRSELYSEGIDVLLKKWDVKRNIQREELYQQLSLKRKEDLLSRIAYQTFSRGEYFFKQKMVEAQIESYIRNLPGATNDPEALQVDSEVVLKAIEAHHGLLVERARAIYSFSHLTFQEFFTARYFKEKASGNFSDLVKNITNKDWREVFLLAVGMLDDADQLLIEMKCWVNGMVSHDEQIQQYLQWVEQKSASVQATYKSVAIRAYYFGLERDRTLGPALDLALDRSLHLALDLAIDLDRSLYLVIDLDRAIKYSDDALQKNLQQLKDQLPVKLSRDKREEWWRSQGQEWISQLRATMIEHRNIGHDWKFSAEQSQLIEEYYNANLLLVNCLDSDCYVSREVRAATEDQLILSTDSLAQLPPLVGLGDRIG